MGMQTAVSLGKVISRLPPGVLEAGEGATRANSEVHEIRLWRFGELNRCPSERL